MTPSASPDSRLSISLYQDDVNNDNNLQPFFVLNSQAPKRSSRTKSANTRRRIDLSIEPTKSAQESDIVEKAVDYHYEQSRVKAFNIVWSKIETTIKQVLRDININIFDEIHLWIRECFAAIRSAAGKLTSSEVNHPYRLITDISLKKTFTGLLFTKNVEFVDDLQTFNDLSRHLKTQGCHVVNLSSLDFSTKGGIGACVRSLLRQLVMVDSDVADITILASWYSEPENHDNPLVVIIEDMEQCISSVLSDFILILSEWVIKLPVILVMGVSTTTDAPKIMLPANTLQHLQPCKFSLGSPAERLYAVVEAVILSTYSGFDISSKVAVFLKNYFLRQDGTVTSFIRALKIACAKHFVMEPLSFLCKGLLDDDCHNFLIRKCALLPEFLLEYASNLPSCKSKDETIHVTGESLAAGLSEIMKLKKNWCCIFKCLYEAAKLQNVQLLDILCEALDSDLPNSRDDTSYQLGKDIDKSSLIHHSIATKGSLIVQVICKVRDLPVKQLHQLLQIWIKHTKEIVEVHAKVKELQSMLKFEDENKCLQPDVASLSKRPTSRTYLNVQRDRGKVNEKVALLMECMVKDYLKPIECAPFHEVVCFKDVDVLHSALIGDPRRMIQVDLLKPHNRLHCSCCTKSGNVLLSSMPDTSIMYALAQEHGDLINLHNWFQSFKSTIISPSKKRKKADPNDMSDAVVQARFCRAVIELQMSGLLRMPSKRRPDFVQRVAFGL